MANPATNYLDKSAAVNDEKNIEETSALVALFLFSLILLASYLMLISYNPETGGATSFFTEISKSKDQSLQIGDMKIGASLTNLKQINPEAITGVNANGQISANYKDNGATFTAWFGKEGVRTFSHTIRYDNVFFDTDEDAVIYELSTKYGSPSTNSCNARITDGVRSCKFTWWLKDGMRFDAITRQPIKSADWLNLTIIATDTRLKNRAQRKIEGALIKGAIGN
ncbi:MAG: hypothetical protein OEW37_04990 [Rhodospirillaceae bacterium]|nr:hypothetical protein [Rhodospirillaceae bacterium]